MGPRSDVRPVFSTFYEDFQAILEEPSPNWTDQIRDRLGLFHINQWQAGGLPRRVFLFRYRVRDLPHQPGHAQTRLLAVPTVVDHRLSEAFCPAPRGLDRGRVVNLDVNLKDEPVRELLHGHMLLNASHLYRVGLVTTHVPRDLAAPRRDHLLWLRMLAGMDDYAAATDGDLL